MGILRTPSLLLEMGAELPDRDPPKRELQTGRFPSSLVAIQVMVEVRVSVARRRKLFATLRTRSAFATGVWTSVVKKVITVTTTTPGRQRVDKTFVETRSLFLRELTRVLTMRRGRKKLLGML